MSPRTTSDPGLAGIDLTDLDNFDAGFPHHLFAVHRREAPVWWHEPTIHTPDGEGFWSVATYAHTLAVLNDPVTYSSERGGDRPYGGTVLADLPTAGVVLNMMDDPRHARIRRLVSTGFSPRAVARLESELRSRTRHLLDGMEEGGQVDFLRDIAAELPVQMICILLGVPEEERHWLVEAVEPGFDIRAGQEPAAGLGADAAQAGAAQADVPGADVPGADAAAIADARRRMMEYGAALVAERRARPRDDMLSVVVHATLADEDPPRLSDDELYMFFSLLFAAGAETTRNAIAGGLLALLERPDQLGQLQAHPELVAGAVEEMLRWTTPSPSKRRTATRRAELGGQVIEAGQKVLVWEGSANRDEAVFPHAMTFDSRRDPNPHLAFGHGPHFCLGASLARLEIRVMFEELLAGFDLSTFVLAAPVEWTRSNRHTGIRHMAVDVGRRR